MIGRTQRVIANNEISEEIYVGSGVPQGLVLGPLLFFMIINDITDLEILSNLGIFSDDSRVIKEVKNEEDAIKIQNDLDKLYDWAVNNNIAFNGRKFECIKIGENDLIKEDYLYTVPDHCGSIGDVTSLRDLGVIISSSGDYRDQIHKVVKKVKQRCR